MAAKKEQTFIDAICSPLSARAKTTIINSIVYTTLTILLLIVLIPLFWMVLTALKTKGTAFSLNFLPKTLIYSPAENRDPLGLTAINEGQAFLHANINAASATTVDLFIRSADGSVDQRIAMDPAFEGVWTANAGPFAPGEYAYGFSVDGGDEVPDPAVPQAEAGSTSTRIVLSAGEVAMATDPTFLVYRTPADELVARIVSEPERNLSLVVDNEWVRLLEESPGVYTLKKENVKADDYRIAEQVPFGTALGRMYTFDNFTFILNSPDFQFTHYFMNSLIVATSAAFFTVLICTLAAYAFAVFPFHYKEPLFVLLLSSMLVPGMIYMVPQFSITLKLGLMNTYAGMVIPHLPNVFGLFLMRQYIGQIPKDLFNAAEIDGARDHQVFRNVVIPMCLPIMVTLFLLVFVGQWSNFLWQLIVNTGDSQVLTLPVGLQQFKGQNANEWERIMAGACFSILPITVLFMSLQNYFLQGLTAGSVKE